MPSVVNWLVTWEIWASLGVGLGVSGVVVALGRYTGIFRRRGKVVPTEEELPWEDLLAMLKTGKGEGQEEMSAAQLLEALMEQMPKSAEPAGVNWTPTSSERRRNRRRWLNPIEVVLLSPFHDKPLHGLVVNRSVGGLAILADVPFESDSVLRVRSVEAPVGIGFVDVTVRHVREVSGLHVLGCQYNDEVPWNVKVWFG